MISFKNVTKFYDKNKQPAIENLNLDISENQITVFLGKSGCGKSTTLKLINKMLIPTSGTIEIDNKKIEDYEENRLRRSIGYVIQNIGLLPNKNVYENIAIVPKLLKWEKKIIEQRVYELLEMVGLNPEIEGKKFPFQLSGGQAQRVGVARGLAANPNIILMDEPFGAVDPITRTKLQDDLLKIHSKYKKTICFVTHDIDEAIKIADKIAIFNNGKIVQFDTPLNILINPENDFVKEFMGETRVLDSMKLLRLSHLFSDENPKISNQKKSFKVSVSSSKNIYDTLNKVFTEGKNIISITNDKNEIITEVSIDDIVRKIHKEF